LSPDIARDRDLVGAILFNEYSPFLAKIQDLPYLLHLLLVIAVSFLPVLTLEAQEGRLFKPLAYTKNLSMIIAAVLAITPDPSLRLLLTNMKNFNFRPAWLCRATNAVVVGTIHFEEKHPISRVLIRLYEPAAVWTLRWKWAVIGVEGNILY
jgi:copper/silver efflux system protein